MIPKMIIKHRSYGLEQEKQDNIDEIIAYIDGYYTKDYPSLGIDKSHLYKNLAGAKYYNEPPREDGIITGGYWNDDKKEMNINTAVGEFDKHVFIHELTHSFLRIRKTFGSFLDEGFVDLQAGAVGEVNGIEKSWSYPENRCLAKMLSEILGEDNLLEYGTTGEKDLRFSKYSDIIHSLRAKGIVATIIEELDHPLLDTLLYSMVDDMAELFCKVHENDELSTIRLESDKLKQNMQRFIKNENQEIDSQNIDMVNYFLLGLDRTKLTPKQLEIRDANIKQTSLKLKPLLDMTTHQGGYLYGIATIGCDALDEDKQLLQINIAERVNAYELLGYRGSLDIPESEMTFVFDRDCNVVEQISNATAEIFDNEYVESMTETEINPNEEQLEKNYQAEQ